MIFKGQSGSTVERGWWVKEKDEKGRSSSSPASQWLRLNTADKSGKWTYCSGSRKDRIQPLMMMHTYQHSHTHLCFWNIWIWRLKQEDLCLRTSSGYVANSLSPPSWGENKLTGGQLLLGLSSWRRQSIHSHSGWPSELNWLGRPIPLKNSYFTQPTDYQNTLDNV